MSKILDLFKNLKQDMHETHNAEALKHILPETIVYDMMHHFSNNKKTESNTLKKFKELLLKQPYVYHAALNTVSYEHENSQNRVLLHGVLFKALFNLYINHLKKPLNSVLLSSLYNDSEQERTIIEFTEYNDMPKRYRGIFVPYDQDRYVLNVPHSEMIISCNKKNLKQLEKLLLRVNMLLPVVYKTKIEPDPTNWERLNNFESKQKKWSHPAFVESRFASSNITDEQLAVIRELHDIFVEIAKITYPVITKQREDSVAQGLFAEYQKELQQKDIFVRAQNEAKTLKANQEEVIKNAYKAFKNKKKQLKTNYKEFHSDLLNMLATETHTRIK